MFIVAGAVLLVIGLLLALDVGGLGTAWTKADLRLTRTASNEVDQRRMKRRHIYFWILAVLGAVLLTRGIFGVI